MRNQFTFYESFAAGIKRIKNKAARCDAYDAIVMYALYGIEPDLDSMPDAAAMAFLYAKPILDVAARKSEGGKRGTRAEEDDGKMAASSEEDGGNKKKNKNEKEKEKEKEKENDMLSPPVSPTRFRAPTLEEVREYCRERELTVDPDAFYTYFSDGGWVDAKGQKVKSWKQKLLTWARFDTEHGEKRPTSGTIQSAKPTAEDVARMKRFLAKLKEEEAG